MPKSRSKSKPTTKTRLKLKPMPEPRSWRVAFLLSLFLGPFGADRFYIGRTRSAIVKLVTLSCFGVWWLSDFILIASDWRRDAWGRPLEH
jgi:TM2 domain-containing membrane protein YozV